MIKRINELDLMVIDNKIYAEMARKYMLKKNVYVNEICFEFKDDVEDKEYYLGYFSNHEKPYWVGQCDIKDGCGFYIVEDLINAKIYNGKSLLECWDNISLLTIEGVPIDEWLEYFEHC